MKGVIYCFHCLPNGKKYIGQTLYENKRKSHHKVKAKTGNSKFYRAIRKYGWNNFVYGVIDTFEDILLNEKETYFIEKYDTFNNGYNSTLGGDGTLGLQLTEESRKKISLKNKGRKLSEEQINLLRFLSSNRKHTKESIEKRIASRRKNNLEWHSKQMREKMSIAMKGKQNTLGKKHTEETKKKIANSVKGNKNTFGRKWWNDGQNEKMSVDCPNPGWKLGRCKKWWNDGQKNKMSVECPGSEWNPGKCKKK